MKKLIFTLLGVFSFSFLFCQTTINVRAFIDGKDQIIIKDSTIQWLHFSYAAPGRLSHQRLPTFINGHEWYPEWPDIPNDENRQKCFSSVFSDLKPVLPKIEQNYSLIINQARGNVFIAQQPRDTNNYSLIIEFDDTVPFGADWYDISIDSISTDVRSLKKIDSSNFQLYPNPTSGIFEIVSERFLDCKFNFDVLNIFGAKIETKPIFQNQNCFKIDLTNYPSGTYLVRVTSEIENYHFKVIKK